MNYSFPSLNVKVIDEINELYNQINNYNDKYQKNNDIQICKINNLSDNMVKINKKVDTIHALFNEYNKKNYKNINEITYINKNNNNKNNKNKNKNKNKKNKIDNEILNLLVNIKIEYANVIKEKKDLNLRLFLMENKLQKLENIITSKNGTHE